MRPFLENPDDPDWDGPNVALSVLYGSDSEEDRLEKNEPGKAERQHFTVRTDRYRYTLTNDGEEELYDYSFDPNEWLNQANNPDYQKVKLKMKNELLQLTAQ